MENLQQYVEVLIDKERYAISIQEIHEIIKMQDITGLPNGPAYLKGVINLRGRIVPIVSLRILFDLEEVPYTKSTRIVVVHHEEEAVGVVVDQVNRVTTFEDIQPPPEWVGQLEGSWFVGIGLDNNGLVGLLKLDRVLLR